jgi:FkbM family methyltransferase
MLKRLAKNALQGIARLFGCELRRISSPDSCCQGIGSMEEFLRHLCSCGFRPKCILDVGANQGLWSELAAKIFPDATFVLIEPQKEMFPFLRAFCESHPASRYIAAGAGRAPGKNILTIWDDLQGSSFLPAVNGEEIRSGRQREAPIVTIDSVFDSEQLPDLVKLDIQGFELEALRGAERLFGSTEFFILEVSLREFVPGMPGFVEVIEFMRDRGYQVYDICGFLRRPSDNALGQLDLAFVRESSPRCNNRW